MITKLPFAIALSGMFLGVFIAIIFGVNEEFFKNRIQEGLQKNVKIQAIEDPVIKKQTLKKEAGKNWRYYQRFHFHSTGIGAMSLSILILLMFLATATKLSSIASYLVSVGGFLYPFVWLFAGIYGPEMGRSEAKETFEIFGYMGGLFLIGIALSIFILFKYPLRKPS
jgi:hypothetical protein